MKLLIINSVCGIKSTGRIALNIAKEYKSNGWECKIAYGRDNPPEEYKDFCHRIGNKYSLLLNVISCRLFDNDGFAARRQTIKFLKWADLYNPDELWIHNLHGYYINVGLLFEWIKKRPNMKVKWTFHDCWPFTGHCCYFDYSGCNQWETGCLHCIAKTSYPSSYILKRAKYNLQRKKDAFSGVNDLTIITPSKWLSSLVKKSFLKNYHVDVVNNVVDLNVFKPTAGSFKIDYGLNDKKIVLGVASPWSERKGLKDFVRLSALLPDSYVIVLVGLSKEQIKKLPPNIIGIEKTNNAKELATIYTASDIFVNATYEDNYPTVNLEAQACGTTCITYNTGGSVESVPSNCIVPKGDIESLAKKIIECTNE